MHLVQTLLKIKVDSESLYDQVYSVWLDDVVYLHDVCPLRLGGHFPVDLEEWVFGQEYHEGLSVRLQEAVDVVQSHALVLDPV